MDDKKEKLNKLIKELESYQTTIDKIFDFDMPKEERSQFANENKVEIEKVDRLFGEIAQLRYDLMTPEQQKSYKGKDF